MITRLLIKSNDTIDLLDNLDFDKCHLQTNNSLLHIESYRRNYYCREILKGLGLA